MYAQMLVGMVSLTGQWWVDVRKPKKEGGCASGQPLLERAHDSIQSLLPIKE